MTTSAPLYFRSNRVYAVSVRRAPIAAAMTAPAPSPASSPSAIHARPRTRQLLRATARAVVIRVVRPFTSPTVGNGLRADDHAATPKRGAAVRRFGGSAVRGLGGPFEDVDAAGRAQSDDVSQADLGVLDL